MALTGLHVACGYAGSQSQRWASMALIGKTIWSETLTTAGTTTNVAPAASDIAGDPIFEVNSAADAFVSIGKTPDAVNGTRQFVCGGQDYSFYAQPGDKLAWAAA